MMCEMTSISIAMKSPQRCTSNELAEFTAFVLTGGEVTRAGLGEHLRNAHALFFMRESACLVGIAALKRPRLAYRAGVFEKSGATVSPLDFPFELGWVFLLPSARGRNLSRQLLVAAADHVADAQVFATTRTDNPAMHASLLGAAFTRHGSDYPSNRGAHRLVLFLRSVSAK
jgi:GNAT superfamily N-acetyltransferase